MESEDNIHCSDSDLSEPHALPDEDMSDLPGQASGGEEDADKKEANASGSSSSSSSSSSSGSSSNSSSDAEEDSAAPAMSQEEVDDACIQEKLAAIGQRFGEWRNRPPTNEEFKELKALHDLLQSQHADFKSLCNLWECRLGVTDPSAYTSIATSLEQCHKQQLKLLRACLADNKIEQAHLCKAWHVVALTAVTEPPALVHILDELKTHIRSRQASLGMDVDFSNNEGTPWIHAINTNLTLLESRLVSDVTKEIRPAFRKGLQVLVSRELEFILRRREQAPLLEMQHVPVRSLALRAWNLMHMDTLSTSQPLSPKVHGNGQSNAFNEWWESGDDEKCRRSIVGWRGRLRAHPTNISGEASEEAHAEPAPVHRKKHQVLSVKKKVTKK